MASKNDIYGLYRVRLKSRVSHGTECTVYFVLPVLFCQGLLGSLNRTNEYGLSTLSVRLEQHTSMPLSCWQVFFHYACYCSYRATMGYEAKGKG